MAVASAWAHGASLTRRHSLQQPRGLLQARYHHHHPRLPSRGIGDAFPRCRCYGSPTPSEPNPISTSSWGDAYVHSPRSPITVLSSLHPRINGAILLAGPYTFEDLPADMKDAVRLYHGEDAEAKGTIPLELLNLAKAEAVLS